MSEMSDMLLEFYKANVSQKLPKPDEADSNPIPTLATAKNSQSDEMMHDAASISANNNNSIFTKTNDKSKSSFHRQNNKIFARPNEAAAITIPSSLTMTAIPTSVVVPTHTAQVDVKPVINPTTGLIVSNSINAAPISVIKPVLASALMEGNTSAAQLPATKLLENFLIRTQREHRLSDECDDTNSDANDGDDEDDSRYNGFEDIHLMEANVTTKTNVSNLATVDYLSDESQKFMIAQAQAQALRQLEYTLGDYSASSSIRNMTTTNRNESQNESANTDAVYECRHCGKKYRWKSTLRRHENVECGGKEPSHQCPYCAYKSKQRGNLGVHVRKHHSNLPQLVSKRRSKYSHKLENSDVTCVSSANVSDDSSNKMIIDFSK